MTRPTGTHQRVKPTTTARDRARAYVRRGKPPCALCGDPIDYTLRSPHPMSFEVDHQIPLNKGGLDVRDNWQPSHRTCNRTKSDRTADEIAAANAPRTFETERTW